MEVLYNNLFTHFVFTTKERLTTIEEIYRDRIEKYITGVVNNHECKLYSIYAKENFIGSLPVQRFQFQKKMLIEYANTLKISLFIIKNKHSLKNMINF